MKRLRLGEEERLLLDGVASWPGLDQGDAVAAAPTARRHGERPWWHGEGKAETGRWQGGGGQGKMARSVERSAFIAGR